MSLVAVLPGRPIPTRRSLCSVEWRGLRLIVYITIDALVILTGPAELRQTLLVTEPQAITADAKTGRIVVSTARKLLVFQPDSRITRDARWYLGLEIPIDPLWLASVSPEPSLSFGDDELLFGNARLVLLSLDGAVIWQTYLPRPVLDAELSPSSNLLASIAAHDRRIKVWRRQSSDPRETRFDFSYLLHPAPVHRLQWQSARHQSLHLIDDVLYSVCLDGKVRIWAAAAPHALQPLCLRGIIDMNAAIQTRQMETTKTRHAFIMDGVELAHAAASLLEDKSCHAMDHLREIVRSQSDVIVVVDEMGNLSAWGVDDSAAKQRDTYNVAHLETFLPYPNSCLVNFSHQLGSWTILAQDENNITWMNARLDALFDPRPKMQQAQVKAVWSGCQDITKIQPLERRFDVYGQGWYNWQLGKSLERIKYENVISACTFGSRTVLLCSNSIELWSDRQVKTAASSNHGKVICLTGLNEQVVVVVWEGMRVDVWSAELVLIQSGHLDSILVQPDAALTALISINAAGECLRLTWTNGNWKSQLQLESGMSLAASMFPGPQQKIAVLNHLRSDLYIWDFQSKLCEFRRCAKGQFGALCWTQTGSKNPLLAVIQEREVEIFSRTYYADQIWTKLKTIDLGSMVLDRVQDLAWSKEHQLILATNTQVLLFDVTKALPRNKAKNMEFFADFHNAILPVYHPIMIEFLTLQDQTAKVWRIMTGLHEAIKFYVPGDALDTNLLSKYLGPNISEEIEFSDLIVFLQDKLEATRLPGLDARSQAQLINQLGALLLVQKQQTSLDPFARNFYFLSQSRRSDLDWQAIVWASQSKCQDLLDDLVQREYIGKIGWKEARKHGATLWMQDQAALVGRVCWRKS